MQPAAVAPSRSRPVATLVLAIAVCELAGAAGGLVTDPSFYRELVRPTWAPPPWLFGPVWITLYALMGTAASLVWRSGRGRGEALAWFAVQLVLNAAWTPVFFGLHSLGGGLALILALDLAIVATIVAFAQRSRAAALLLAPYAGWVAFATALTAWLWHANG